MAQNAVQFIQRPEEVTTTKGKSGGGKWGQIAGAVAGAALGAAAAGATGGVGAPVAMAALSGAGAGGALGGSLGEIIKPTKEASTAIERRIQAQGPQMQQSQHAAQLKQSLAALQTQPDHIKAQYTKPLLDAYMTSAAKSYTA
jgi:Sec-independent protein translocase protein TatA